MTHSIPLATPAALALFLAVFLPAQGSQPAAAQKPTSQPAAVALPKAIIKTSLGEVTVELFANEAPKTVANFIELADGSREFSDASGKKVKRPFYDGLTFHRVIKGFMAQGGCPRGNGSGDPGYKFGDEINAKALSLDQTKAVSNGRPHQHLLLRSQQDFQRVVMGPLFQKLGIKSQKDLDARRADVQKAIDALTLMDVYQNMGYRYDDSRPSHGMQRGTLAMANSGPNTNGSQFFINMVDNVYLNGKHTVFGRVVQGMDVVDKMATQKLGPSDRPEPAIKILSIRTVKAPAGE